MAQRGKFCGECRLRSQLRHCPGHEFRQSTAEVRGVPVGDGKIRVFRAVKLAVFGLSNLRGDRPGHPKSRSSSQASQSRGPFRLGHREKKPWASVRPPGCSGTKWGGQISPGLALGTPGRGGGGKGRSGSDGPAALRFLPAHPQPQRPIHRAANHCKYDTAVRKRIRRAGGARSPGLPGRTGNRRGLRPVHRTQNGIFGGTHMNIFIAGQDIRNFGARLCRTIPSPAPP